jgi:hypothetical protein
MAEPAPSRRTLVRGAAWSVPVVAVAATAPAYAASTCAGQPSYTMNLASKVGSDGTSLGIKSVVNGVTVGPYNLSTSDPAFPLSGWLELENVPRATSQTNPTRYQDVTLTFGRSVSLLQFTVSDLDSVSTTQQSYWDRLAVVSTASAFTATPVMAGNTLVTGAGTLTDPLRQASFTSSTPASNNDGSRQMRVSFTGTTRSITLRFWSSRDTNQYGTHAVWIGNMTYKTNCSV